MAHLPRLKFDVHARLTFHTYVRKSGFRQAVLFCLGSVLCFLSCNFALAISFPVAFNAASIETEGMQLNGVAAKLDQGALQLKFNEITLAGQADIRLEKIQLECNSTGSADSGYCPDGVWGLEVISVPDEWKQMVEGELSGFRRSELGWEALTSLASGAFNASTRLLSHVDGTRIDLNWEQQDVASLPFRELLPESLDWVNSGSSEASIQLEIPASNVVNSSVESPATLVFRIGLEGLGFDSPEGLFAAEGLELDVSGKINDLKTFQIDWQARIDSGELLLDQFYASFSEAPLTIDGRMTPGNEEEPLTRVEKVHVSDGKSLELEASARFLASDPLDSLHYQVKKLEMRFPLAYHRYLEPVLASKTLDGLGVTGELSWSGSGEGDEFPNGTLVLRDLSVVDPVQSRFAFTGMSAQIEVGDSQAESLFSWQGMLLGRINLGSGSIGLLTAPGMFELANPLRLAMLGGDFVIDEFSVQLPDSASLSRDPTIRFNASLDELEMQQLTTALGWPSFDGTISGQIPGASFSDGVLRVDGELGFDAFDGEIVLSDLRIERLFGVLPSLAANLKVRSVDLQLLTSAFSFGQIAGRLDGYVNDLRMLDWSPVSFDAWFGTPESQSDSRQISRQAVNNLTSIGGGGATAALTGPIMRLFSNFSYRRIGMGCKLENYVCEMRGLQDEADSVLIMEGSGVPKLMIRVFNRRMDFPQLVANLAAASEGEKVQIGKP